MSLPKVMFVDDEPNLLSGLRRLFRNQRGVWDIYFANGGQEALELADSMRLDVVVTDMRMPGMNGAELLTELRRRQPHAARIILSGHAERESIITAVGPAQQFLAKPCSGPDVVEVVDRALALSQLVPDDQLRTLVCGADHLAITEEVAGKIRALLDSDNPSPDDLAAVIETCPGSTAELFKMVNSAFFGLPRQPENVRSAVTMLGTDIMQGLVRANAAFKASHEIPLQLNPSDLALVARQVANRVRALAIGEGWSNQTQSQLYVAGLMHNVGLVLMGTHRPQGYEALLKHLPLTTAEQSVEAEKHLGCCGYAVSGYLLGLWGFAPLTVESVAQLSQRVYEQSGESPEGTALRYAVESVWQKGAAVWQPEEGGFLTQERLASWADLVSSVEASEQVTTPMAAS